MDQVKIGRFIARLRGEQGLTQSALGETLGVTNKTVSRWETGTYMPDVEMLQLLSRELGVSINELLCGERLSDESYRSKADKNLLAALQSNVFSTKERSGYWTKKWQKEHRMAIVLCCAAVAAVLLAAWYFEKPLASGLACLAGCMLYAKFHNDQMGYVEGKIYG